MVSPVPEPFPLDILQDDFLTTIESPPGTTFDFLDAELTTPPVKHFISSDDEQCPEPKKRKGGRDCSHNPGRNAEIARLNRERKKAYVSELESTIKTLEQEVLSLKAHNVKLTQTLASANKNISYLRDCLQHETKLGQLLAALSPVTSGASPSDDASASEASSVIPITINVHIKK